MNKAPAYRKIIAASLILAAVTFVVYLPTKDYNFVTFDDYDYVVDNAIIKNGFTLENISCIFTSCSQKGGAILWHPLTWLSLMFDYRLFGMNPGGYHAVNLAFHILNTILLFLILNCVTGALWRSAFVAALFALHPLHVESVVWISERKDVLSTFFGLLSMAAYIFYVKTSRNLIYAIMLIFFSLSLMAKSMLVTLPFLLLLFDYWPLARTNASKGEDYDALIDAGNNAKGIEKRKTIISEATKEKMPGVDGFTQFLRLLPEKIPLFIISAAFSIVTYLFHLRVEGINVHLSLSDRLGNAIVSYAWYIYKMFWPFNLAVLYPFRENLPAWQIIGAALLMVSLTAAVVSTARRLPYLTVGWFWYLGTLMPVIGIIPVGMQAMADRYTYFPVVGLFIMLVWGISDLAERCRHKSLVLSLLAGTVILFMVSLTSKQITYWKDGITLWQRALQVTEDNHKAHYCLASTYRQAGDYGGAVAHIREALKISPNNPEYLTMLGTIYSMSGQPGKAIESFYEALKNNNDFDKAHYNLGLMLLDRKQNEEALEHLKHSIRINSKREHARLLIGNILVGQGKVREAISYFEEEIQIRPNNANVCNDLGSAYYIAGNWPKAAACYRKALLLDPDNDLARQNLSVIQKKFGEPEKAATCP